MKKLLLTLFLLLLAFSLSYSQSKKYSGVYYNDGYNAQYVFYKNGDCRYSTSTFGGYAVSGTYSTSGSKFSVSLDDGQSFSFTMKKDSDGYYYFYRGKTRYTYGGAVD